MKHLKLYAKNEKDLDSLIQTVRVFSEDIGLKFGIKKFLMLLIKNVKKLNQKKAELQSLDGQTRKLQTMYNKLHPLNDIDRI